MSIQSLGHFVSSASTVLFKGPQTVVVLIGLNPEHAAKLANEFNQMVIQAVELQSNKESE